MSSSNKRVDDLRHALRTGECTNGNHRIRVTPWQSPPDGELCKPCSLNMRCYLQGKQIPMEKATRAGHPCVTRDAAIEFYYHGSCCITFNIHRREITDHGYYGYSVTTTRSIRWYVEALLEHDYIESPRRVDELMKAFRKLHRQSANATWLPPGAYTKQGDVWIPANE